MKKQILSILYITIVSLGFAQDFNIKSWHQSIIPIICSSIHFNKFT